MTLKSNAIACVFLSLVATLPAATLGHALERLGCPDKLVFLFLFTGRYIHLLAAEWEDLVTAARLRGFRPRTDLHTGQWPPCWGCCWCAAMSVPSVRMKPCACAVFRDVFIRWTAFVCVRWISVLRWPRHPVWPAFCGQKQEGASCGPVGKR